PDLELLLDGGAPEALARCASTRAVLAAPALDDDDRFPPEWREAARAAGRHAALAVPVEAPGGEVGLALVFYGQPRRFSDYDLELARNFAGAPRGAPQPRQPFRTEP